MLLWFFVIIRLLSKHQSSSKLWIPAIKLNRHPNLFLRFLYLSFIILNLFKLPITFSFTTRSEDIFRFSFFSSSVKGFFLLDFFGSFVLLCSFFIPVYPLSVIPQRSLVHLTLLSLNNLKSCFFPLLNDVQMTFFVFLSTITWVFNVCLFFFPE